MTTTDWVMLSLLLSVVGYVGAAFLFYRKVYTAPVVTKRAK